ncbi:MAG TPA: pyrroline-5-carboxylate reductase [Arenicellales bacterium]|jgi:pyrroline-5-carboxylate reductase|nr:pyrroline-5-carboxylate reductase [Acidiferrobacteraceae bacterium]MDP6123765.1 pyrroline-5-carboxylate reductase [Arenicellales bacterium]MDP7283726.1 pyrroline-5-carboxylate reductase [Arenicellales bacterium]HJL65408.1 pyrroline-5-carboxylate reductase [Arenicellales bacterium]HJP26685.1 pyrroline-5-carboxylate reductase [Arenicellales bacterium]|tara:strand:- start:565 stop:1398 length:834 start_codon:yes stop_codon:yes gene_type:complete
MTPRQRIGFIGGGNMTRSIIGGLITNEISPNLIKISDPDPGQRDRLVAQFGITATQENREVAEDADVVVLAVKPQVLRKATGPIGDLVRDRNLLVISIAAGVRIEDISSWLGGHTAIVRVMPNTPALVGSGASALFAPPSITEAQCDTAESILRAVGITVWLTNEDQIDTVTALSGSGPAYFFYLMEAMEATACKLGLTPKMARLLTLETAIGAARLALESSEDLSSLRKRVTSPGGTTERAIEIFDQAETDKTIERAISSAAVRSRELADLLGGEV